MNILNKILQWIIGRLSDVGTVYTGTKLVTSVPRATGVDVLKVKVPPGTYVVTACVEWSISSTAVTVMSIQAGGTIVAIARGTMDSGGGDNCSSVVTVDQDTDLRVASYQAHTTAVNLGFTSLKAIRIK